MKIKGVNEDGTLKGEWYTFKREDANHWYSFINDNWHPCNKVGCKDLEESYKNFINRKGIDNE